MKKIIIICFLFIILIVVLISFKFFKKNRVTREFNDANLAIIGVNEPETIKVFLRELQKNIRDNSFEEVFDDVYSYAKVNNECEDKEIFEFYSRDINSYNKIFTEEVKKAILDQKFEDLYVDSRGINIGDGSVWIAPVKLSSIRSINDKVDFNINDMEVSLMIIIVNSNKLAVCPFRNSNTVELKFYDDKQLEVKNFLENLQKNVKNDNVNEISNQINYPLRVNRGCKHYSIANETDFKNEYNNIFTESVKADILNEIYEDLGSSWKGYKIERTVEFLKLDEEFKLLEINVNYKAVSCPEFRFAEELDGEGERRKAFEVYNEFKNLAEKGFYPDLPEECK